MIILTEQLHNDDEQRANACNKKYNSVRGYKLTFFLAAALLITALLTKLFDKRELGNFKSDTGSWFLLAGGVIMTAYGYYEYNKKKKNK